MKRTWRPIFVLAILSTVLLFCAVGCSDSTPAETTMTPTPTEEATVVPTAEPTEEATETPSPSAEPSYVTFGTESADARSVLFTNGTGQDIDGLRVRNSDNLEFGDNLIPDNVAILPNETFRVFIPVDAASSDASELTNVAVSDDAQGEEADGDDPRQVIFNETYDVQLVFADGRTATLYDLGIEDITDAVIEYSAEDEVAYLTYVSAATKDNVSTLDAQIARSMDEAAAAAEENAPAERTMKPAGSSSSEDESASSQGSSSGSQSASGSSDESSGSGGSSSGGSSQDNESSYEDEGGSYEESSSGGDSEAEPEQEVGDCVEDMVIWND